MKSNPIKTLIAFTLISTTTLTTHADTQYSDTYKACMDNSQGIFANTYPEVKAEILAGTCYSFSRQQWQMLLSPEALT